MPVGYSWLVCYGIYGYANDPLYPVYSEVVAGFSATVGIILRLSPSGVILHIEGIEQAVVILKISLLHHYPREPPYSVVMVIQHLNIKALETPQYERRDVV